MVTAGRRELHKRATRQALQEAATRMFEERGFAETTVRDIAEAVGVTERTFFRYFASKEDLVLGEVLDLVAEVVRLVRERPAGEGPYTAVLNALSDLAAARGSGVAVLFTGLPGQVFSHPGRSAQPVLLDLEEQLARALHARLGPDAALRASVLARASVGALRATVLAFRELPEDERTVESARDLARQAFDILRDA
ncbi:TetR family transcriptional regulator [Nonomuraea sp. NPDC050404]|uniref:TetR family transcriptional regulator n=1 Tax=Nonomuraea sp. NPDC050404 TaxID=3155783 RepID=UPI0033C355D3